MIIKLHFTITPSSYVTYSLISLSDFECSGFMILMYIFETYLDLRQHTALKLPTLPKPLIGVISQEKFEKSRAYSLDKRFEQLNIFFSRL